MLATNGSSRPSKSSKSLRSGQRKDDWKRTFSFVEAKLVGHGGSGSVFAINKKFVIKVFSGDEEGQMDLKRERAVYERLQSKGFSEYIVRFVEEWASGLILERHLSTLRQRLIESSPSSISPLSFQWTLEICNGVEFLHENGVFHSDLGCQNILVDENGHAKLCDFAGSKIEDKDAWITYEVRSQHPSRFGQQPTVESELFALGSIIFEIWTSRPPYASEPDTFVRQKFKAREFPLSRISNPQIQQIAAKCWKSTYKKVSDVCAELESIKE